MIPLVEFCVNNLTDDVLAVKKILEKDPTIDVLEYSCLGNCSICAQQPYALVNGELVKATNQEELLDKIYHAIEKMNIYF